ncbi:response regulator [bacterium]|nr:response regulator [bacterium]
MEDLLDIKKSAILVVDDEPHVLDTIVDVLEEGNSDKNFKFYTANSGAEALNIVEEYNAELDLVITDQRMPDMTGAALLLKMTQQYPDIGSIIISGYADFSDIKRAIRAGTLDYIKKPYDEEDLNNAVRNALHKTKLRKRNKILLNELEKANKELEKYNEELEGKVKERTEELEKSLDKLKKMQQQLVHSEKMSSLGQLVAGVAHEVNNPATSVYAGIQALETNIEDLLIYTEKYRELSNAIKKGNLSEAKEIDKELEDVSEDMEYLLDEGIPWSLKSMKEGATRIKDIIKNLKTFSRIDEAEIKHADINEGIQTTLALVHHELKNRVEVIEDYAELPFIECYASELNQVFMNILVNAAQAVAGEGKIWITTYLEDDWVYIKFKDTGKGIPPEILKDIFNPFFTTKPVGVGTGLGLSISYGIIEKHGGEITVTSEVGKGSEFIIKLPAKGIPKKNNSLF